MVRKIMCIQEKKLRRKFSRNRRKRNQKIAKLEVGWEWGFTGSGKEGNGEGLDDKWEARVFGSLDVLQGGQSTIRNPLRVLLWWENGGGGGGGGWLSFCIDMSSHHSQPQRVSADL